MDKLGYVMLGAGLTVIAIYLAVQDGRMTVEFKDGAFDCKCNHQCTTEMHSGPAE